MPYCLTRIQTVRQYIVTLVFIKWNLNIRPNIIQPYIFDFLTPLLPQKQGFTFLIQQIKQYRKERLGNASITVVFRYLRSNGYSLQKKISPF